MSVDFNSMDGYQFEDYISSLFRKLGFVVEMTSYSNDGGVDLIATCNQPIFSGKYIIQCKNWAGPVGQPEVRDLYGVVMDVRANKGIIITPSDYTEQAYKFAEGKNIELINGKVLKKLEDTVDGKLLFSQKKCLDLPFYNDRYFYLESLINDEPNIADNYISIINYLRGYIKKQDMNVCTPELFDNILEWIDKMIKRCFKTASKSMDKEMAKLLKAESYILSGKLAEATELLLRIKRFWITDFFPYDSIDGTFTIATKRDNQDITGYYYAGIYAWNLYAAFNYLGYEKGCQKILSRLKNKDGELSDYYSKKIFGKMFVYSDPCMESECYLKIKHLISSRFWTDEIYDPKPFFEKYFVKSKDVYAKEIDDIFELYGI